MGVAAGREFRGCWDSSAIIAFLDASHLIKDVVIHDIFLPWEAKSSFSDEARGLWEAVGVTA